MPRSPRFPGGQDGLPGMLAPARSVMSRPPPRRPYVLPCRAQGSVLLLMLLVAGWYLGEELEQMGPARVCVGTSAASNNTSGSPGCIGALGTAREKT